MTSMAGCFTRPVKVEDMQGLERVEKMIFRWLCEVPMKDRKKNQDLRQSLIIFVKI
jgi:hypothetical protein